MGKTSRNRRITQAKDIKRRAKAPSDEAIRCAIPGCHRLTQRSARKGLSEVYCPRHSANIRRHGHPTRRSYWLKELEPYREAANLWLRLHREDSYVLGAIAKLDYLMASQGRSKDAYHQRSLSPRDKARNTLARLHEAGKTGKQLLSIVLTIKAAHSELGPWGAPDWQHVQIAKQAKKLRGASGTRTGLSKLPIKYPRGEGLFMRHLGQMIEERAANVMDGGTIEEVKALRRKQ